jgi:hypothetical protein
MCSLEGDEPQTGLQHSRSWKTSMCVFTVIKTSILQILFTINMRNSGNCQECVYTTYYRSHAEIYFTLRNCAYSPNNLKMNSLKYIKEPQNNKSQYFYKSICFTTVT